MDLILTRNFKGSKYTIGKLYINSEYFCDTIEDVVRPLPDHCPYTSKGLDCMCDEKKYGLTAIPAGTYKCVYNHSNRFNKELILLLGVPHFKGVRIHSGNTELDSSGCIILGENKIKGMVINSRPYIDRLNELAEQATKNKESITILIT